MKYQSIIEKMTLAEKASLLSGKNTWQTMDYETYGIPSIFLSDGPHGLRKQAGSTDHLGLNPSLVATCFPTAAAIANSWDEQLGEAIGKCLGEEANALGVDVVLGPGLNIKRNPLCGRNFEYFSEDPYLSGKMAAAYIRGIQSQGVAACPKHFAANSQELRRMASDSVVDERTFREIYTTGFEIAVKEGRPKSIMTSYNKVNGVYANENAHLLQEILADEWGFDGFVVSDWGGSNDHVQGVKNGSHLEMPSTGKAGIKELVKAVEEKRLSEAVIDKRVDELLQVIFALDANRKAQKNAKIQWEEHHKTARRAAAQSVVLLKNEENLLPLERGTKVAVIGDFAQTPRYQGSGSSIVNPKQVDTTLDLIGESGLVMTVFAKGYARTDTAPQKLIEEAVQAARMADTALVFAGLDEISEIEGLDRKHMKMAQSQNELIEAVAAANPNTIVVLSAGSVVEMPWLDKVKAVVHGYLGGGAGAGGMLDVLTGAVCPGGRLNETYPLKYEDVPSAGYFPGKECTSEYRESIFVGYRYYGTVKKPVQFPFGYGLSYTTFSYADLALTRKEASFTLTNTGTVDGTETAQLYIGKESGSIFRPYRELKGFQKVFLKAGESTRVTIALDDKAFRYYNIKTNRWETESGIYQVIIGTDALTTVLEGTLSIAGTQAPNPYKEEELLAYYTGEVQEVRGETFEHLLGHPIPNGSFEQSKLLGANDTVCQMYYAKSPLARLVYRILNSRKEKSEAKGNPDLNIQFIYNIPFRGIAKMTGGIISMDMADAIVEMVNGHFFRGMGHFITRFFANRK